ncbi:hypothetical protein AAZV13_07G164500 [Glycine max]
MNAVNRFTTKGQWMGGSDYVGAEEAKRGFPNKNFIGGKMRTWILLTLRKSMLHVLLITMLILGWPLIPLTLLLWGLLGGRWKREKWIWLWRQSHLKGFLWRILNSEVFFFF